MSEAYSHAFAQHSGSLPLGLDRTLAQHDGHFTGRQWHGRFR